MPRSLRFAALRRTRRRVLAHRRPLAALLAAVAVVAALQAQAAPAPPRTAVLTAARDLPAGVVLRAADLTRTPYDPATVPTGVLPDAAAAVGRTTTAPVRRGEPMTDVRLVARSVLTGYPGLSAVPVRIGDPGVVRLLRVGDRVDLLAADPQADGPGEEAAVVGRDVPVLAIPRPRGDDQTAAGSATGALVVLGLTEAGARTVAQAAVSSFLSVVVSD